MQVKKYTLNSRGKRRRTKCTATGAQARRLQARHNQAGTDRKADATPALAVVRPMSNTTTVAPTTAAQLAAGLALPIEELDLGVRAYNALKTAGVNTVGELAVKTEAALLDIRNIGQRTIDTDIKPKLAGMGLQLGYTPQPATLAA